MPTIEIAEDNIPANTQLLDVLEGNRTAQISMSVRGAFVALYAVASAVGLTHGFWIGDRNPVEQSVVPLSATPNQIITDQNLIVAGLKGVRGERISLFVSETAGVATNDYRARVVVTEA